MKESISFIFKGRDILVDEKLSPAGLPGTLPSFTDKITGASAFEADDRWSVPDGLRFIPLREFFATHDEESTALASRMKGYLNWANGMRYCPYCGTGLVPHPSENAMNCPACGRTHYPHISPCIITVISRGNEILLLRHRQRNSDIWCCLAGFVETGESLEHALKREIYEETGITVKNVRYAGSQGWPFPDQLMVGFQAEYESGEIRIQEDEIMEAEWFRRDNLPPHPAPGSISWNLIHFKNTNFSVNLAAENQHEDEKRT